MRLKPLVDVVVDPKNVNSALVVDGYQCIDRSLSKVKGEEYKGVRKIHALGLRAGREEIKKRVREEGAGRDVVRRPGDAYGRYTVRFLLLLAGTARLFFCRSSCVVPD